MKARTALAVGSIGLLALIASACGSGGSADVSAAQPAAASSGRVALTIGYQDAGWTALVDESKVLDGASYDHTWAVLVGPAAELSALYAKKIDVGHMGDTSLIFEQGNADTDWTTSEPALKFVAAFKAPHPPTSSTVTAVRTSANINSAADLKGKKWSYNYGGNVYGQYVMSLRKAGIADKDVEGVRLPDNNAAAAAFVQGQVDVFSGSYVAVASAIQKGDAKVFYTSDEVGVPALSTFTARADVLADPAKKAAVRDFLTRLKKFFTWYDANPDTVQRILQEVSKQTPEKAKLTWEYSKGTGFYPFDQDLIGPEQKIADAVVEQGELKRKEKFDVSVAFATELNDLFQPKPS